MEHTVDEFPTWGLLPKRETGVSLFLSKHPEYNGAGTTIAIFDSGIDPGAPGLKETPEGKIKVIERFDCSGCGDVATTTIVTGEDGFITGLSGRNLKIPVTWCCPTNTYRIGLKNGCDLYPEKLRDRMLEEYKKKHWTPAQRQATAEATRKLDAFEKANLNVVLSDEQKFERENLESFCEHLHNVDKKYSDCGVYYDCILFHNGDYWMACVDTSETGDLESCAVLGEYSITHDYAPLTEDDQLNFSINVHQDGDVLELVGMCSSHGTHVASICSAYFADEPERNGVAPGAQIISLTIGDGRLGSMETGTSLVRAMIKVMELCQTMKVDVINMSYGEHAHWSNAGRIGELMSEVVNKYGVVWVASAGNHGPALSTIGTPPDISQEVLIGVGAYVSPDMMIAEYAMRRKLPGMPYTWSSRGPTIDGGVGVTVCAPGGAITSVPNFTLRNSQLMNGTSMASPHVAGAVAVLISGLKKKGLNYSPYSIKRALQNGASLITDVEPFAQGSGLMDVSKSFQLLTTHHNSVERDVHFHISCGPNNMKGIYIRNKVLTRKEVVTVSVEPFFLDNDSVQSSAKINFNIKLVLVCKESYVKHPKYLDLCNMPRAFGVEIDASGLTGANTTFIEAFDARCVERGAAFRIPITIIVPVTVTKDTNYTLSEKAAYFQENSIKRHFITVPEFATWAVIKMRASENMSGQYVVHCMHIVPKQSCKTMEINKFVNVLTTADSVVACQVRGLATLEVCIAKYWANLGKMNIDYSISFYGIKPVQHSITMLAAEGVLPVEVNTLQGEEVQPSITLRNAVQILRPTDNKISPLSERDVIPPERQIYELVLTYTFHIHKATDVSPNCPVLSDVLYESEFESQLWMLYDTNKQFLGCGDAYPSKYNVKLEKGDYVLKLQVRHDKKDYLEKLTDVSVLLSQKLATPLNLDVYSSFSQAVVAGKKSGTVHNTSTSSVLFYIAPLPSDKYAPKTNNSAHYLSGTISFAKDEVGKRVDSYCIKYILSEAVRKHVKTPEKSKTKSEEFKDAVRELELSWMTKLDVQTLVDKLYTDMLAKSPDHPQAYTAYLQSIEAMDAKHQLPDLFAIDLSAQRKADIRKIMEVCDTAIKSVNQDALLKYLAIKNDTRANAAQIKTAMDRNKNVLIECLSRKGIALCRLSYEAPPMEEINKIWSTLMQFVDYNDSKNFTAPALYFASWHAAISKQYGRLLRYLQKINEEKPCKEIDEKLNEIYAELKWAHVLRYMNRQIIFRYPPAHRPF